MFPLPEETGGAAGARAPPWRAAGLRYYRQGFHYRQRFGGPVRKLSLDGGFGCPNRDGTLDSNGCIFCDTASFSPSRRRAVGSIAEQLDDGARRLSARYGDTRLVAYFQPATNTYAPVPRLRQLYEEALRHPRVIGLAIGTRPDCAGDEVLDLLAELAQRTSVWIEYGLQTIHDRSLQWLNRRHDYGAFLDAAARTHQRGLHLGVHVILGLPGETPQEMLATARELSRLQVDSVKIHNLYAVKQTPLAEMVACVQVSLPSRDEYVGWVADFLEHLWPDCVIERLSGDAPPEYLVAPQWCSNKSAVRGAIEAELQRRNTWQGKRIQ